MILDEEIGGDTCHGRSCHILYESSYSLQIKSVRKLHDKLITFRRSDKSVFYRILAAETCFPPTPFPYAQRQSESGFTYFNEKLQNLQIFFSFFSLYKRYRSTTIVFKIFLQCSIELSCVLHK